MNLNILLDISLILHHHRTMLQSHQQKIIQTNQSINRYHKQLCHDELHYKSNIIKLIPVPMISNHLHPVSKNNQHKFRVNGKSASIEKNKTTNQCQNQFKDHTKLFNKKVEAKQMFKKQQRQNFNDKDTALESLGEISSNPQFFNKIKNMSSNQQHRMRHKTRNKKQYEHLKQQSNSIYYKINKKLRPGFKDTYKQFKTSSVQACRSIYTAKITSQCNMERYKKVISKNENMMENPQKIIINKHYKNKQYRLRRQKPMIMNHKIHQMYQPSMNQPIQINFEKDGFMDSGN